ncbi:OsmC family protein [Nocardioides antri]|uniref:OsmC family peroxiredoxin n=1 Tax=Nocardioides antri TaxID=2607659 RepID=A0A5B1M0P6_9ACTN|nr:OsmC family protein [Nocardioides antri]KAA1426038.1 OsmC family peroxiredoxin [Nocardioides antri]
MADLSPYGVRASAGSLRAADGVVLPHVWTEEGVAAGPVANGAQAFHLSVALCVLNDVYREAELLGIPVQGVAVVADGGFDVTWASTGISYQAEVDSPADPSDVRRLLDVVDEVAEIPRAVRAGAEVTRR